jgi:hypothetical protein
MFIAPYILVTYMFNVLGPLIEQMCKILVLNWHYIMHYEPFKSQPLNTCVCAVHTHTHTHIVHARVSCDSAPCSLVLFLWHFKGTCLLQLQGNCICWRQINSSERSVSYNIPSTTPVVGKETWRVYTQFDPALPTETPAPLYPLTASKATVIWRNYQVITNLTHFKS